MMLFLVVGIAGILIGFFCTATGIQYEDEFGTGLGIFCILSGLGCVWFWASMKKSEKKLEEEQKKLREMWEERRRKSSVPEDAVTVDSGRYFLWYRDDRLLWFPATYEVAYTNSFKITYDESRIKLYCVPKGNIYYYAQSGELHTEVSGSGGGSAYSVITGFHGRIKPIKISTTVHDNRYTQLIYKDGSQDCEFDFAFDDIAVLRRLLPEKDYEVVAKVEAEKQIQQARPAEPKDEKEKLQKAKELLDAGLITQEEYEQARQKALKDLLS